MPELPEASLPTLVGAQLSCRGCPLRVHGPVPVSVPLQVVAPRGLLVLPRPFSDSVIPTTDPRRQALVRTCPAVAEFATTFLTSCWSDPGEDIPTRSVVACRRHRSAEVAALSPAVIVTLGSQACQEYAGLPLAEASGQAWQHGAAIVVPLPERPEDWSEPDLQLLATTLGQYLGEVARDLL